LAGQLTRKQSEEVLMTDEETPGSKAWAGVTIQQIIDDCEPMGDLGRLLVSDLTEEDEDTFFGLLEEL
jgi:hypothetical protein